MKNVKYYYNMETFDCGIKLKKEIEVTELVIYPIYRKMIDALTNEIIGVFKADSVFICLTQGRKLL